MRAFVAVCFLLIIFAVSADNTTTTTVAPDTSSTTTTTVAPAGTTTTAAPIVDTTTAVPSTSTPTTQAPTGTDSPAPVSTPYTDWQKFGISCATFSSLAVAWGLFCFAYEKIADRCSGQDDGPKYAVVPQANAI